MQVMAVVFAMTLGRPLMRTLAAAIGLCAWLALGAALVRAQPSEPAPGGTQVEEAPSPPTEALAGGASSKAPTAALEHYQRGREHYLAGRYREALEELKAALALDPDSPNLIYNVARVHEDLGNLDEAITNYQHYLEVLPDSASAEREKTDLTIRRLRGAKDEVAAQRSGDAELKSFEPATAPQPTLGNADWLFWASAGTGVAFLAGGSVCGVLALQRNHKVADFVVGADGTAHQRRSLVSQTKHLALASDLLFAGGAAAITGAALLFFLRHSPAEQPTHAPQASVYFDGQRAELLLSGAF